MMEYLSAKLKKYRDLVHYYNNHQLNEKMEYDLLVKIVKKLKDIICRLEKLYTSGKIRNFVVPIADDNIPRGFTMFGIIVNAGVSSLVLHILRSSALHMTYDTPSKYVALNLNKEFGTSKTISVASPVMIAYRNGNIDMLDLLIYWRNKGCFKDLVQEFHEPLLINMTIENLKLYRFVQKHFSQKSYIFNMCRCNSTIELTVSLAYVIGHLDLLTYFVELESERTLCHEYIWRYLVYHSIYSDRMKIFCYFVQIGLYIDKFHLKHLRKSSISKIGFYRNTLLEFVFLSGVHIELDQLLLFSDTHSRNGLSNYLCHPPTLLDSCRMNIRKYFRNILPPSSSIFRIINQLNIPNYIISFLKMEDFIDKNLDIQ